MSNVRTIIISFENGICAHCLCMFVKSVINTRTTTGVRNGLRTPVLFYQIRYKHSDQNPQILVQEAQKSEDFSFAWPGNLCDTPKPRTTEKAAHSTDYLAEMLTRRKRRQDRQRGCGSRFLIPIYQLFPCVLPPSPKRIPSL